MVTILINRGEPICDFCSGTPVVARYRAEDFIVFANDIAISESVGDWAACAACEALVDAQRWDDLITRAVEQFFVVHPDMKDMPMEFVRDFLTQTYARLRESRITKVPL
jgi:hypothetical protein